MKYEKHEIDLWQACIRECACSFDNLKMLILLDSACAGKLDWFCVLNLNELAYVVFAACIS